MVYTLGVDKKQEEILLEYEKKSNEIVKQMLQIVEIAQEKVKKYNHGEIMKKLKSYQIDN